MKKIFLALLMGVTMLSCSKDENNSIEGTWVPESITYTENGVSKTEGYTECEKRGTVTISGGKIVEIEYDTNEKGECQKVNETTNTYTISGNKITIKHSSGEEGTVEYSVTGGDTLTTISKEGTKTIFKRK